MSIVGEFSTPHSVIQKDTKKLVFHQRHTRIGNSKLFYGDPLTHQSKNIIMDFPPLLMKRNEEMKRALLKSFRRRTNLHT
jgi:hypothetical protein